MRGALLVLAACGPSSPEPIVMLAPDHSRAAVQRVAWEWGEHAQVPVQVVYATSAEIERLVDTGATTDVVLAPTAVLEALDAGRHLVPQSRRVVSGDQLVVARLAQRDAPPLSRPSDLIEPGAGTVALAAAASPLGLASRRQLRLSGAWLEPSASWVDRPDGAGVVQALHQGAADWGVVEGSRAAADPDLQTVLVLTEGAGAAAILYEAATTEHARSPALAGQLVDHLADAATGAAFVRAGWVPRQRAAPEPPPTAPRNAPEGRSAPQPPAAK